MSGALSDPLSIVASKLRQYDILCKVLRLLPEAVDVEPVRPVEPLHEIIARMNLDNTPYLQPTVEAEEIRNEAGRVWTRQLKTIDERLRWKLESGLLDMGGCTRSRTTPSEFETDGKILRSCTHQQQGCLECVQPCLCEAQWRSTIEENKCR